MNILVACEESQAVTIELRKLGHRAFSCDIVECSGGHPEWHIDSDVSKLLGKNDLTFYTQDEKDHTKFGKWDMIIAFPPCTDLCVSGARHFAKKIADGTQQKSIEFFMKFANADCDKIAIENPIGIMSSNYRKPDQIIHPWQFGHNARKKTCLWLKGLQLLIPTNIVDDGGVDKDGHSNGFCTAYLYDENGKRIGWNDPRTAKARSKTFPGIAKAMATQWTV
jgi:site-specific DNA-cytosine methylase